MTAVEPPLVPHRLDRRAADRPVRRRARAARRAARLHDARRPAAAPGRAGDHEDPRPQRRPGRRARLDRPEDRRDPRHGRRPDGAQARVQHRRAGAAAGGLDVQGVRAHGGDPARRQPVGDEVPVRAVPRPEELARADVRAHVQRQDPARRGDRSSPTTPSTRGSRSTWARSGSRSSRTSMGVRTELQAGPADRPRGAPDQPARPRRRVHHARRERDQAHAAADRARRLPGEP